MEITALNEIYLQRDELHVQVTGRGIAWFDMGTHDSLLRASTFVEAIEERQGTIIACLEEIAFSNGWIKKVDVEAAASQLGNAAYANYLRQVVRDV